ncbi:MAG: T9SS type A sorting domain-containing protein [Bacteroidetes bacterium]|nr:T9SS type A sorting domain-containing protein [Bacteroidota bacterium]
MIKRFTLLALLSIFSICNQGFAQCTPDVSLTIPGIYPDSTTGLPSGVLGQPYSEVIQVRVLTDTSLFGAPVIVTSITITGVTGLPPGITYSCNPASCIFPGGTNGCILLSGTPTAAGAFTMNVDLEVAGTLFGSPLTQPSTVDYYVININSTSGVNELGAVKFDLLQNKPNPAINFTDVTYSSPIGGDFTLRAYNMIGKEVFDQTVRGMAGLNTVRVNTSDFAPGVYMLSIENGSSVVTRRMIVSRK